LIAVFEILGRGRLGSKCKYALLDLVRELPNDEILESTGNHAIAASTI
jgi:hypothetical protein